MINLVEGETILHVMRRHWFVYTGPVSGFVALLASPPLLLILAPQFTSTVALAGSPSLIQFSLAIYLIIILMTAFVVWMAYYLDAWVVTNRRIIDIQQRGLFWRTASEIPLDRVENVTISTPGFLATLFGFSNMKIETAGEEDFVVDTVSGCEVARDLILEHSEHRTGLQEPKSSATQL